MLQIIETQLVEARATEQRAFDAWMAEKGLGAVSERDLARLEQEYREAAAVTDALSKELTAQTKVQAAAACSSAHDYRQRGEERHSNRLLAESIRRDVIAEVGGHEHEFGFTTSNNA